jgi:transposase
MLYQRGRAYSQDLRERVFAAWDDGERVGEVSELLRVSVAYVSKALTRRRTTGETTVRAQRGHKLPKLAPFYAAIRAYVAERGDTTIAELRTWLLATHQVAASVGLIWHTLKLLGLSLKKSRCGPRNRIDRTSPRPERNGARTSRSWTRVD